MRWLKKRPEKAYCRLLRENTTFHGIRDSIATGGWLRALWICIIFLASMAALIGCGFIVWEFNNRPLSVTYSIRENVSLIIPDIIICPFNRFNKTYLNYWNVSDNLAQYLELAFPQASQHPFQYKSYKNLIDKINDLEEELNKLLLNIGISFADFIDKAAINCKAFFASDKSICDNSKELMSMTGKCFRIKGEEQKIDGNGHPQKLILNLPTKLFNPAPNQMLNNGILVKLAERNKGIDHDMSFIPAGVHAMIQLTATRFEFKHYPPHFLCREEEESYSRVWCFEKCFLEEAEKKCNCSLAAASQPGSPNICTPRQFFNCFYIVLQFTNASYVDDNVAKCKTMCLPPCRNWRFDKTISYANFPSEVAKHFVKDKTKWENLQNTIILDVFYTTLDYTVIQQMLTITPSSFIAQLGGQWLRLTSKLGGQISLWIGGSIISVIQLIIYLISYLFVYFRRTRQETIKRMRENRKRRESELLNIEKNKKEIALEGGLPEPAEIEILCQKEKRKIKRKNKKEENKGEEEISSKFKKEIKRRKRRRKIGKEIKFDSPQKSDKNNIENSDYNYEMDDVNCITARV
ncbi:unnamed protein product [Meloidogyne enterolobii]|uniref:Uncharacterized protein n=1 Tax=Meloidogyne enterolobii TaxID=390850 RepID=A0ACB0ZIH7_MELEN